MTALDDLRSLILDALNDVTVDALVTNAHAEQLADELAAAMARRGFLDDEGCS